MSWNLALFPTTGLRTLWFGMARGDGGGCILQSSPALRGALRGAPWLLTILVLGAGQATAESARGSPRPALSEGEMITKPLRAPASNHTEPEGATWDALPGESTIVVRHFELRWSAPNGCADASMVAREVERLVGRPLDELKATLLVVQGTVTSENGRFVARLRLDDGSEVHSRSIEGSTCSEVTQAAVLSVAMALNPAVSDAPSEVVASQCECPDAQPRAVISAPCPTLSRFAPSVPRTPPLPYAPHRAAPPPPLALHMGFGAGITGGVLPDVTPALLAMAGLEYAPWRLEVLGAYASGSTDAAPEVGTGAMVRLWSMGGRFCWLLQGLGIGPCGGGEVGRFRGQGYGVSAPATDTLTWVAATGGVLARRRLAQAAEIGIRADALAPLHRPAFRLAGRDVARPDKVSWLVAAHTAMCF